MNGTLTLRAGPAVIHVERRTVVVSAALVVVAAALALVALGRGQEWAGPGEVVAALAGYGDSAFVIRQWRLPRGVAALVFGAALGLAGAVFQNLTRNALGSPDVIGLDAGAYTGVLVAVTVLNGTAGQLAAGSVAGGLLAAVVIYLLSLDSGLSGMRLVVIGIAVNAMLTAVNSWIVLRAELDVAIAATTQTGDQGLTLGRTVGMLAGLPVTVEDIADELVGRDRDRILNQPVDVSLHACDFLHLIARGDLFALPGGCPRRQPERDKQQF